MFRYLLKRLQVFIPTLFVISLLAFWLSKVAPGDPVLSCNPLEDAGFEMTRAIYQSFYEDMGLDKPLFYFSLTSTAYPDTFHLIPGRYHQKSMGKLIAQYGNWEQIQAYRNNLEVLSKRIERLPDAVNREQRIQLRRAVQQLFEASEDARVSNLIQQVETIRQSTQDSLLHSLIADAAQNLAISYHAIKTQPTRGRLYLPRLSWKGFDNQYHHWIAGFLQGDFGVSCQGGRPVLDRLRTPIYWTLILSFLSMFFTYLLAIPLGVFSAVRKGSLRDKITTTLLFILYSLPSFWIGTMLLVFFTTPEYGMNWFAGAGLGNLPSSAPFWDRFWETAQHLILPVLCLTYPSLAFVSRQMRGGMLDVLQQDYIRTAQAKGVSDKRIIWKHSFRNALFPMLTIFATVFPAAVTGAVIIEVIFNIPGMGREVVTAIFAKDWPVLYTVLMLVAILTMLGNLIVDVLYAVVDPRVRFTPSS